MFHLQLPDEAKSYLECVKQLSIESKYRDARLSIDLTVICSLVTSIITHEAGEWTAPRVAS